METSGPPVVRTREHVAEEGEGGGSISMKFNLATYLTHIHTSYIPLISVIYIGSLLNGRRLQFIFDPLRMDASPLNVEDTL